MPDPTRFPIQDVLRFHPRWWWDPVPDWFLEHIDKGALRDLAVTQIQLQKVVLDAQLKAVDKALSILGKVK
jgi:hypothetical protein